METLVQQETEKLQKRPKKEAGEAKTDEAATRELAPSYQPPLHPGIRSLLSHSESAAWAP